MSSLNSEATKELLLESDILATPGRIDSIWSSFTKDVSFQNGDNDLLKVVLLSLQDNVIDHLKYSDERMDDVLKKFQGAVGEISACTKQNSLTNFLVALSTALTDYESMNSKLANNTQINMSACESDVSIMEETAIASILERYGLLNSTELEGLLDEQNSSLATAYNDVCLRLSDPADNGSGVNDAPLLTITDFIPGAEEIIRCGYLLVNDDEDDQFPDSPLGVSELISIPKDFDESRIYRKGTFLTNQANLKILTATASYIASLSEMDASTAMYSLSTMYSKLKDMKDQLGLSSITFSQIVVISMLIRFTRYEYYGREDAFRGGILTPDFLKFTGMVCGLRKLLLELLEDYDQNQSSVSDKEMSLLRGSTLVDDYVEFVEPNSQSISGSEGSRTSSNDGFSLSDDSLKEALDELLSDLGEILIDVQTSDQTAFEQAAPMGQLEALSSPNGVERVTNKINPSLVAAVIECGKMIHEELNKGLLGGDLESAANSIARELVLKSVIDDNLTESMLGESEMHSIKECIERDVSTYKTLCESVSGGISKYEMSAKSFVHDKLKKADN